MGEVDERAGTKGYTTMPDFAPTIKEMTGIDLSSPEPTPGVPSLMLDDEIMSPRDEDIPVGGRSRSSSTAGMFFPFIICYFLFLNLFLFSF